VVSGADSIGTATDVLLESPGVLVALRKPFHGA
jgi:hypothetical protein